MECFFRVYGRSINRIKTSDLYVNYVDAVKMLVVVWLSNFLRHVMSEDLKDLKTYQMDHYCGQTLGLDNVYQFVIHFEPDNVVLPDYSCNVTFTETNDLQIRMAVRVVDYEVIMGCDRRIELHDFSSRSDYMICGTFDDYLSAQSYIYSTWTNALRLKYIYGTLQPQGSFKIAVTLFHEGQCASDEVKCSNGYCIKHTIYCNGHRPCGYESSGCGDKITSEANSAAPIVIAVIVPSVLLAIVGVVIYGYFCKINRCRNSGGSDSNRPRFWFNALTSRGTTESNGVVNEGANFDDPPDYNSLNHSAPSVPRVETLPSYDDVIQDTVKYKVVDNTHETIVHV